MNQYEQMHELHEIFHRIINKYMMNEKKPRDYGTNELLHLSEVHTIDVIGKHNNINITLLANLQGVTKGAVSQMVDKLCNKDYVNKAFSPETENEVVLTLTDKGNIVFKEHLKYHRESFEQLTTKLKNSPFAMQNMQIALQNNFSEILIEIEKFIDSQKK